jgi:hypothetical protein
MTADNCASSTLDATTGDRSREPNISNRATFPAPARRTIGPTDLAAAYAAGRNRLYTA